MRRPTHFTPKKQATVLGHIAEGWTVRAAAQAVGIDRHTVYDHLHADPAFKAAYDEALEAGTEFLEQVARQRAIETSDVLLIFLLKARRPGVYREYHRHELAAAADAPLTITVTFDDPRGLDDGDP